MIKFKNKKDQKHFLYCAPKLIEVILDMYHYFDDNGHEFMITSFIRSPEENEAVGAKSSTHMQGRAFDLRIHDIPSWFLIECRDYYNKKFENIAAWSLSENKPVLVKLKKDHLHIQIHSKYSSRYAQDIFKQENRNG